LRLYQRTWQRWDLIALLSHSFEDTISLGAVQNVILVFALPNEERKGDAVFQDALLQLLKIGPRQFFQFALQWREVGEIKVNRCRAPYCYRFHRPSSNMRS